MQKARTRFTGNLRYIILLSVIFFGLVAVFGSGGGGGDGSDDDDGTNQDDDSTVQSENIFYSNPTDERVLKIVDEEDGSNLTYYGDIDANGELLKLTSVVVDDPEIDGNLVYILDDDGNPTTIYTPEYTFEIEQASESEVRLTAIPGTGEFQVTIPVEVSSAVEASSIEISGQDHAPKAIMDTEQISDSEVRLTAVSDTGEPQDNLSLKLSAENKGIAAGFSAVNYSPMAVDGELVAVGEDNVFVILTQCGKPVENAYVKAIISPKVFDNDPIGTYIGNGTYAFNIPRTVAIDESLLKKCDKISEKIKNACSSWWSIFYDQINTCDKLASAVSAKFPESGEAILKNCTPALINNLPKIKKWLCEGEGANQIELACEWEVTFAEPEETYTISFEIKTQWYEESLTTEEDSFSPNRAKVWDIELPNVISLEKFSINPPNPKNNEYYTACASFVCPDPENGTTVSLSVTGSGGLVLSPVEEVIYENKTICIEVPAGPDPEEEYTETITVSGDGKESTFIVHRNAGESTVAAKRYYVFKRSGTGYRKMYSGWVEKRTGYDYFYHLLWPSQVTQQLEDEKNYLKTLTTNSCNAINAICPCTTYPDIWENGGNVELVGSFDTDDEMDQYRCDTYQWDPYNVICTKWEYESSQTEFWDAVNSICP